MDVPNATTSAPVTAVRVDHGPEPATAQETTMQAIVQDAYGSADVLELAAIDKPMPTDNQVLVKVHAAGLHRGDWHVMTGLPYLIRIVVPTLGLRRPKVPVLGMDVAGTVEAVGGNVTRFQPGDEVFGWCDGAFAEYACAPQDQLAAKPATLSFEQAAAVPISGFAALQGLRDVGEIQPGQRVLIIGAAGGVGSYAVQLAKAFGAQVTGVASTSQVDLVRSIGADEVIDYTREDVTDGTRRWDLILDTAGRRSLSQLRRALTPRGTLVIVGGEGGGRWMGASSATCGRRCCHGSWASGCACWPPRSGQKICRPCGSCLRSASSRHASAGPTRWPRSPRPCGRSKPATLAARSSSPCEARTTAQITGARTWDSATAVPWPPRPCWSPGASGGIGRATALGLATMGLLG
jgi:NADPH:quinone reductase-like Zn-dependent oxidoreductase